MLRYPIQVAGVPSHLDDCGGISAGLRIVRWDVLGNFENIRMEWTRGNQDYARVAGRAWQPGVENPIGARAPQLFCGARWFHAIMAGDQAGLCSAVHLRFFDPGSPATLPFQTGPGDEPRWRMNVLGDIEQSWLTVIPVAEDQARV